MPPSMTDVRSSSNPREAPASPLEAARALAPRAAHVAAEAERARRLPAALVAELASAGLFALCVPAAVGGVEAPPQTLIDAVEVLAQADGAAGWCVAIAATSGLLGGYLPEQGARQVYGSPGSVCGGVFAPRGRGVARDGGFEVSGRWPFASGCEHCDWLMGGAVVEEGGSLRMLPNGMPDVRLMLAPAGEWQIHDTWRVSGLRATGSHDIELADRFVPAEHAASVFSDAPVQPGPLYAFPLFGLLALAIGAVGLGIARGALDDLIALAGAKTPTGSRRPLAQRSTVQADTARAEATLRGARALLRESVAQAWEGAQARGEVSVQDRTVLRLASTHAATTGASVAATAYQLGGGSAIYDDSPLQRRFRDANVVTQHMLVGPATLELTGRLLLGLETDTTQL
jgi:alkylation response protein AidB-like acyl-CoA dehydrogenase